MTYISDNLSTEDTKPLSDSNLLEEMLNFAQIRNSRLISKRLLNRYGNLDCLIKTDSKQLQKQPGVDEKFADFLLYIPKLTKYINNEKYLTMTKITSYNDLGEYIKSFLSYSDVETFFVVLFDSQGNIVTKSFFGTGSVRTIDVDLDLVRDFLQNNPAEYGVISHNHPHGMLIPSMDDYESTCVLSSLFKEANVVLLDHIIANNRSFISLAQSSKYANFFSHTDFFDSLEGCDFETND